MAPTPSASAFFKFSFGRRIVQQKHSANELDRKKDRLMKHLVGMNDAKWRDHGQAEPVILNTDALINGHTLIAGMSGTGKSHQIMRLLSAYARAGIQTDVFDVHEELGEIPGACAVKYSAATMSGYNPLVIHQDIHSGGPKNQIDQLVDMINRTSTKLGARQESCLRNLVADVYYLRGIYANDPASWRKEELTEDHWERLKANRDWAGFKRFYPTLRDVIEFAERTHKRVSMGSDSKAINALERVNSTATRIQSLLNKQHRTGSDEEIKVLQAQLEKEKEKTIDAFVDHVRAIELGREYRDAMQYTNGETLLSLIERLHTLQERGIFCSNPPDFRGATIQVHQVGSLREDERRLHFYNRGEQILRECMDMGKSNTLRRVIGVDEGHLYYSEDGDNPMNRIAKEGRKFGLGLMVASQSPTHFSEDFLTNCGTIMLLGIHKNYWDMAARKLNIDKETLTNTRPREVLGMQMHVLGESSPRFVRVNVDEDVVARGTAMIKQQIAARTAA